MAERSAQSLKSSNAAIEVLAKRDNLTDKKIEMERMHLSTNWSIATPWVRGHDMSKIDPARLVKSVQNVAAAFDIPKQPVGEVHIDRYLPARVKLMLPK